MPGGPTKQRIGPLAGRASARAPRCTRGCAPSPSRGRSGPRPGCVALVRDVEACPRVSLRPRQVGHPLEVGADHARARPPPAASAPAGRARARACFMRLLGHAARPAMRSRRLVDLALRVLRLAELLADRLELLAQHVVALRLPDVALDLLADLALDLERLRARARAASSTRCERVAARRASSSSVLLAGDVESRGSSATRSASVEGSSMFGREHLELVGEPAGSPRPAPRTAARTLRMQRGDLDRARVARLLEALGSAPRRNGSVRDELLDRHARARPARAADTSRPGTSPSSRCASRVPHAVHDRRRRGSPSMVALHRDADEQPLRRQRAPSSISRLRARSC